MNANGHILKHFEVTDRILKAFFRVYNTLGYGFNERVYENSLALQLRDDGLVIVQQAQINVFYNGVIVGEYFADLLVNDLVIVELKAVSTLTEQHEAQLLNYLKATHCEVGLLLNFGPKPDFKRRAFDNDRKGGMAWTKP